MTQEIMKLAQNMVTEVMMGVAEQSGVDRVVVNVSGKAKAALQTALQSLATESETHKENAMRNARLAVAYRAERDALQSALEAMQASLKYETECVAAISSERDALQAKLTELQKQEPVCYDWQDGITPLYASPKALEPMTDEQLEATRKDAIRYRVLRDANYQHHEDDVSVADSSFTVYFGEELDAQVDALEARHAAIEAARGIGGQPT